MRVLPPRSTEGGSGVWPPTPSAAGSPEGTVGLWWACTVVTLLSHCCYTVVTLSICCWKHCVDSVSTVLVQCYNSVSTVLVQY
jgi:hypothetical protein